MNFTIRKFSNRFPPLLCAVFVVHEPDSRSGPYTPVDPGPDLRTASWHRGTAAAIILSDGRFWVGVALCSPDDCFVKKVGRQKAIGRAYQAWQREAKQADIVLSHEYLELSDDPAGIQATTARLKECLLAEILVAKKRMAYA